jgi:tryptophan synthase beta chain
MKVITENMAGPFVPETLMYPLEELELPTSKPRDPRFHAELDDLFHNYSGRPTALYFAERLTKNWSARIYLKREDLNHTGAHKINNCLSRGLRTAHGKETDHCETGAGQHGVYRNRVCSFKDSNAMCTWAKKTSAAELNVFRMKLPAPESTGCCGKPNAQRRNQRVNARRG